MTKSPSLQTSISSWAMNFLVYFLRFRYLGTILYLSTATLTVFCILSDTTLPMRALRGVGNEFDVDEFDDDLLLSPVAPSPTLLLFCFGREWMRVVKPGKVVTSFSSSLVISLMFSVWL